MQTAHDDLRAFYSASYSRLVGTVGLICGDSDLAADAVQDSFVILLRRWDTVRRYDNPESWVRRVALQRVSNRRRKALNGIAAALRHGPPPDVDEPTPLAIDADRAVRALPTPQRAVLVLHRLGLDINAIADELDIPVNTAKSRLARARAALAPQLREDHRA